MLSLCRRRVPNTHCRRRRASRLPLTAAHRAPLPILHRPPHPRRLIQELRGNLEHMNYHHTVPRIRLLALLACALLAPHLISPRVSR